MSKTKIISLSIALIAVVAGLYFKVDISKALEQVIAVEKQVDQVIDEPAK